MSLSTNYIIQRARAVLAQLTPITGTRAAGSVLVTATAGDIELPRNSYLVSARDGTLMPQHVYKTAPNTATVAADGSGGAWTVTDAGTSVNLVSNVGGARHNLSEGDVLQWDPPIPGLARTVIVEPGGLTGGTNGVVQSTSLYEELGPDARGLFEGSHGHFPAVMIVWDGSSMAEGKSLGLRQGGSRKGRRVVVWFERYLLFVISSKAQSDAMRRREGLDIVEDISALICDRHTNDDREMLTVVGPGLEINDRRRFNKSPNAYIYQLTLRLSRTQRPIDNRVFNPWLRTTKQVPLAADPPLVEKDVLDHEWEQEHPDNE